MKEIILNHPLIEHKISILRKKDTSTKEFRELISELAMFLCFEALKDAKLEACLKDAKPGDSFQFIRNGYFCVDNKDSKEGAPVFNRIVGLKSSYKPQ